MGCALRFLAASQDGCNEESAWLAGMALLPETMDPELVHLPLNGRDELIFDDALYFRGRVALPERCCPAFILRFVPFPMLTPSF